MIRTPALLGLAAATLAACGESATTPTGPVAVAVENLICRPTPRGQSQTACYASLTASGPDRLVSVSSPVAAEVQLHNMSHEGGIMRMAEMPDGLALPAGQTVALAPGGDHIMVLGLNEPLEAGDTLALALTFEHATAVELTASVGTPQVTP